MQEKTTDNVRPGMKLYLKPEKRFERVFETMALSCGKVAGGGTGNCGRQNKTS